MIVFKLIFLFFICSYANGVDIRIGALFDYDVNETQKSFEYAIYAANTAKTEGLNFNLVAQITKVPPGNEFMASKRLCKLLRTGVSAVFGPMSPSSAIHCMNICDAKEIPYIDVRWDGDTKPPVINMHPHPDAIAQVFVDLITAWNWKGFTILYESAPWLSRVSELLKINDRKTSTVTVRKINLGLANNYRSVLRRVKLSDDIHIVLDCSIEALPDILMQAQQVGLMTDYHQFIITTLDTHTIDLEPYQYSGTNITAIRLIDPENEILKQLADDFDQNKENSNEELLEGLTASKIRVQTALIYDGIILIKNAFMQLNLEQIKPKMLNCNNYTAWENGNSITNFMRNTVTNGLTGYIKFDNQGLRTSFAVDIIELTSSGIEKIGTWNASEGLNISRNYEKSSSVDEHSLKNKTFIVLTSLTSPYGMLKDSAQQLMGNDRFEGFGIDLINELSIMLGFNYTFKLQEDGVYGSINNVTKEWTGMIKELLDERADLAITDLTITSERESGVDFTMPFMNLGISILFRKPTKEPPSTFSFMSPFSTEVWMYLGGAYLGVSLCLFILGRISPSEWDNPYPCIEEPKELENQFSLRNSLWFTIGALLQQGSEIAPKAPSTRAVAAIWWFFTLIMVSSYTANLAAFLTVESVKSVIKGAEELKYCADPDYECPVKFGAKRDGSTINFFKEAEHGTYKSMYTYMSNHPELLTNDNAQGLEWAKTDNYAFLMESSSIEYLIERNCDVTQIGGLLDDKGYGIAMRKNSNYRSALSEGVLRLQEQGKLTALKIKWWKEKKGGGACAKKNSGGDGAEELGMQNMKGVFYVLLIGSSFASCYGILEWFLIIYKSSVEQKVPFKEELKAELLFIAKCQGNTKTVRHRKSASVDSRNSTMSDRSNQSKYSEDKMVNSKYDNKSNLP